MVSNMLESPKRLKDTNGVSIGTANKNSQIYTHIYEIEYLDGCKITFNKCHSYGHIFIR